jgi:hypothetical protein
MALASVRIAQIVALCDFDGKHIPTGVAGMIR